MRNQGIGNSGHLIFFFSLCLFGRCASRFQARLVFLRRDRAGGMELLGHFEILSSMLYMVILILDIDGIFFCLVFELDIGAST